MSQVVAFTFGSLGDIFTLLGLAWSVQRLLSDRNGASTECRELVAYLNTFSSTLRLVHQLAFGPGGTFSATHNGVTSGGIAIAPLLSRSEYKSAANAVWHSLWECHRSLDDFSTKLAPYMESLRPGGSGSKLLDIWRKLSWTSLDAEASNLRRGLKDQVLLINTVTTALSLHTASSQSPSRGLPIGVYLTDMLNVESIIPTEWCRDPMAFNKYLRFYFTENNRKGKAFVTSGRYTLESDGSHELLSRRTWASHVQAGMHILMDAVVERDEKTGLRNICPSCNKESHGTTVDAHYESQCSSCGTICKMTPLARPSHAAYNSTVVKISASGHSSSSATSVEAPSPDEEEEGDLSWIRRIAVVPDWSGPRGVLQTAAKLFPPGTKVVFLTEGTRMVRGAVSAVRLIDDVYLYADVEVDGRAVAYNVSIMELTRVL